MYQSSEEKLKNIFNILGIDPTEDFSQVKKAYIRKALATHPDKNPNISQEDFKDLQNCWEKINSAEKLSNYFKFHVNNRLYEHVDHSGLNSSSSSSSGENNEEPSNALKKYRGGEVNIFIAVPFVPGYDPKYNEDLVSMTFDDERRDSNIENIRQFIVNRSKRGPFQIGVTPEEAISIINQHSHYQPKIIVQVTIAVTRLSDDRMTEAKLYDDAIGTRANGEYFYLQKNSEIDKDDIISIRPMTREEYSNTKRFISNLMFPRLRDLYYPSEIGYFFVDKSIHHLL